MAMRSGNYSHWITHNYCKRDKQDPFQVEESYDSFHFIENDPIEDFYINSTPSEDIWKKFELIPTPPLSPRRDDIPANGVLSPCSTTEKLRLVSGKLDNPISYTVVSEKYFNMENDTEFLPPPVSPASSTSSTGLISDCMWSAQFKEKVEVTPKPKVTIRLEKADLSSYITETNNSDECVDPTAVFPFPMSDARCMRSVLEAQPDSESSESDEEIDVVTVPKLTNEKMRSILPQSRNPNSLLKSVNLLNQSGGPTLHISFDKRSNKVVSLKRKSLSLPASPEPREKKIKRENSVPELTKLASPAKRVKQYRHEPRYPSDDDSCTELNPLEKRAQHNVLERKRRYDLKYSFMLLRDVIPQLETHERAPKVTILQKAVDCIEDLHEHNRELLRRKDYEQRRKETLQRRIEELQLSCY